MQRLLGWVLHGKTADSPLRRTFGFSSTSAERRDKRLAFGTAANCSHASFGRQDNLRATKNKNGKVFRLIVRDSVVGVIAANPAPHRQFDATT